MRYIQNSFKPQPPFGQKAILAWAFGIDLMESRHSDAKLALILDWPD